jgi:hypothetical protein
VDEFVKLHECFQEELGRAEMMRGGDLGKTNNSRGLI